MNSLSQGAYLSIREELEALRGKDTDPDDEECFDFQNEESNLDFLM